MSGNVVPGVKGFVSVPAEDRFWSKVEICGPAECWPWTGARSGNGYGSFSMDGRQHNAHVIALMLDGRPVPPGLRALHHCDNRPCCNPAHLYVGTDSQNKQDMWDRGRHPKPRPRR